MRVGRSVDAAISVHAAVAAAHHAKYTDGEVDTILAVHAALATVHQDAPGLIATHEGDAVAHQDAPGLIATHEGDAVAHQDAPGLILTHKGDAVAHQDAPGLIATHEGDAVAHQDAPGLIATHAGVAAAHHTPVASAAAGDALLASADTEETSDWSSWTKVKEMVAGREGGTYRFKFDLKTSNASYPAHGRIYKNGSPVGVDKSTASTSYVTQSDDLAGWAAGDAIELWVQVDAVAMYVKNFRAYAASGADPVVISD